MKMNEDTDAFIYVAKKENVVREARLEFKADAAARVLPRMKITRGLVADGVVRLTVNYNCFMKPISPTTK